MTADAAAHTIAPMAGRAVAEAQRALAVMLVTDLVGSTGLWARDEAAAAEVLRAHLDRSAEVVEAHGGHVVKRLGDGLMARFVGASDALLAAVAIQQAVDRLDRSRRAPAPLSLRVGLSAGDVTIEHEDVVGTPVIEAARLCAAAQGGRILASEVVRLLAGPGAVHRLSFAGRLDLKGLPEPLSAWEVGWDPATASPVPLPGFLDDGGRTFVGRGEELAVLRRLWGGAEAARRVALLGGEPGVGKTRLAGEMARAAHSEGALVLAGRCDEDLGVPYQPIVEALRHLVDHAPLSMLASALGRHGGELVRLVPELESRVPGLPNPLRSDPETERHRLFDAVAAWLAAASSSERMLLVLDDLQWAAKPTLLLLRHLLRSPERMRVLVVATYRDTDMRPGHGLVEVLADARRLEGIERMRLAGLDAAGVASMVRRAVGRELEPADEDLARAVWQETDGNPFFVGEVLRHLTETGSLARAGGGPRRAPVLAELGIPEGVREVVVRRLSRLSEAANEALSVAAVMGAEFELPVLQWTAGLETSVLLSALDEGIRSRLITEAPGRTVAHRFCHALVRDTIYYGLSGVRRLGLHRRVADAIEQLHAGRLDDHLPALAHHAARARASGADDLKAVDYARRAGERALAQLAHHEAVGYYRQALEILDATEGPVGRDQRVDLVIALGEAQRRAGEPAYRTTLLEGARLAREAGNASALARAALANARGILPSSVVRNDAERIAALEAALSLGPTGDSPQRARLLANLGLELTASGDRARRLQRCDEALAISRRLGDDQTLAHVLTARFYALNSPATLEMRLSDSSELVEIAERLGDPVGVALARFVQARALTEHGDIVDARASLARASEIAEELGEPTLRWYTTWARAAHVLVSGRIDEAERLALKAGELETATSQPDAPLFLAAQLLGVRFEQGRLGEVEETWATAVDRFPESAFPRAMLAVLLTELDRREEARPLLARSEASGFSTIPVNNLWLSIITALAVTAARLRDRASADVLIALMTPYADQVAGTGPLWFGPVKRFLGMLAGMQERFEAAERAFEAAATMCERLGAPLWLARTRLEWARVLGARAGPGDEELGQRLLREALATARRLGSVQIELGAVALLGEA